MSTRKKSIVICLAATFMIISSPIAAQELYPVKLSKRLWHDQQRELRYKPEGTDFVITNGDRLFTRALYGTHTAFRVETGDRPEFALYMPGMGGNLKFGIAAGDSSKWLTAAKTITAKYKGGAMHYTIQDLTLGNGKLLLEILAMAEGEGFIVKLQAQDIDNPLIFIWAFGGATGKRFNRDGDMGPDPASNFDLKPENCYDNGYTIGQGEFTLKYGTGIPVSPEALKQQPPPSNEKTVAGMFPPQSALKTGDAARLSSPSDFYQSQADKSPALAGRLSVEVNTDYYFVIHNPATQTTLNYGDAPAYFAQAEAARKAVAGRIVIKTPDPYINTIGGALAIASDGIWEDPSYMHGAIGWRMRLNGWRGAYTADVLGWHDRAKTHLESYAKSQLTTPDSGPVVADTSTRLARSLEKLGVGMFTAGYISRDPNARNLRAHHYDMNLVYIDILLRHYSWTGDLDFLKQTWPVLKRHLEWEKRNFDVDGDGLYDAYAAIWASDALQYSGGGVAHSSAYNYLAFKKAAEIAGIIGEDPTPYRHEADKILNAMNAQLWIKEKGVYAEYKDLLGNKLPHHAAALWTVYHTMDSETMNAFQAYQSLRYIDNEIPHIPVKANGLEDDGYYTLATTNWMPYVWSLNNVALAESMHTSLANWQGGRTDEAFKLFKSEVLASMYLGGSPGNIVQISHYDAVRKEAYRDFADPAGMFSRALVEGLFGIVPDALNKTLVIRPGLPSSWNYASFSTPDISFDFKRSGPTDTYTLIPKFPKILTLKFQVIAQGDVKSITINGKATRWKNIDSSVGKPVIEIGATALDKYTINITWKGGKPIIPSSEKTYTPGSTMEEKITEASVLKVHDPQNALTNITTTPTGFSAKVNAGIGNYTVFAQLRQGKLLWWMPVCFSVRQPFELINTKDAEENSVVFRLRNNTSENVAVSVQVNDYKTSMTMSAGKTSDEFMIPESELVTGTNKVKISPANGKIVSETLVNWNARKQGKYESVDLASYFNDKVTQIFRNKYLSPRPNVTTLQLPWQGIGDWPHYNETFDVDDSGLRKSANEKNTITLPQGIHFATPGDPARSNILFTSQWDNYPREKTIPLSGKASHAYFLMAGSTNPMQSRFTNGEIVVQYTDGSRDVLALRNPETWWPIDQDYYTDGFAFYLKEPRPIRVHLKSGNIVSGEESKSSFNGKKVPGGAATVLDMLLDDSKTLQSITLRAVANDVVIGMMAITLSRN